MTRHHWTNVALLLPLVAIVVVLILQAHTNERVDAEVKLTQQTAYASALNLYRGCVRGNAARAVQLEIYDSLIPGTGNREEVKQAELVYARTTTHGISAHPNASDPHLVAVVDCQKFYPVPPKP